ncbi:hypothetical protein SAMN05444170_0204 [Bradyrhizobium erythrophlei]|uniref:Uncharacterized protein n=1 Tax=Bradyrhizobium erythrophlei TaxID=1437360 RepID=A0A1M7SU46_9BRAD|nr:hypothetical protein SAMN05444170_0204 [Bradyrhizobium erythrophlei]
MATAAGGSSSRFIVIRWPKKNEIFYGLAEVNASSRDAYPGAKPNVRSKRLT